MKKILMVLVVLLLAGKARANTSTYTFSPTTTQTFTLSPTPSITQTFTFSPTTTPTLTPSPTPTNTPSPTLTMTVAAVYRDVFNAPGDGAVHFIPSSNFLSNEAVDIGLKPGRYKLRIQAWDLTPVVTTTSNTTPVAGWVSVNRMDYFRPGYGVSSTAKVGFNTQYVKVKMESIFPIQRCTVVVLSGWVTYTPTFTATLTITPTSTPTWTPTRTATFTFSPTYTWTPTSTQTPTFTVSPTATPTTSPTATVTPNLTQTYIALIHAQQTAIAATLTATP